MNTKKICPFCGNDKETELRKEYLLHGGELNLMWCGNCDSWWSPNEIGMISQLALELQDTSGFPCEECEHTPDKLRCDAEMCAGQFIRRAASEMNEQ